jgi:hypothetical protein
MATKMGDSTTNGLITINILDRYHNGMHIEIDAGIVMTFDKSGT